MEYISKVLSLRKLNKNEKVNRAEPWSGGIFLPVLMEKIPQVSSFLTAFWSVLVLAQCGH